LICEAPLAWKSTFDTCPFKFIELAPLTSPPIFPPLNSNIILLAPLASKLNPSFPEIAFSPMILLAPETPIPLKVGADT
jgi:hypothetical protein